MTFIVLNSKRPHTIILNGFDRSGSSAISRTLAQHPDIELFMQPFNSGPVRKKMYQIWDDSIATEADIQFFKGLEQGLMHRDYIQSHWFEKYSSVKEFVPGHIHIVKTTLNHFLVDWCQSRFPEIHQWAIWRDPWDILASLVRNDFIGEWYEDAVVQVIKVVTEQDSLSPFRQFLNSLKHPHVQAAFLIGVRSFELFSHVLVDRVIFYDEFKNEPSPSLMRFLKTYDLAVFNMDAEGDMNVIGAFRSNQKPVSELIEKGNLTLISSIFAVLIDLMKTRFPDREICT